MTFRPQVGDRIRHVDRAYGEIPATVTRVHSKGFEWKLDQPWCIHPRLGLTIQSGEDYYVECGRDRWEPLP